MCNNNSRSNKTIPYSVVQLAYDWWICCGQDGTQHLMMICIIFLSEFTSRHDNRSGLVSASLQREEHRGQIFIGTWIWDSWLVFHLICHEFFLVQCSYIWICQFHYYIKFVSSIYYVLHFKDLFLNICIFFITNCNEHGSLPCRPLSSYLCTTCNLIIVIICVCLGFVLEQCLIDQTSQGLSKRTQ